MRARGRLMRTIFSSKGQKKTYMKKKEGKKEIKISPKQGWKSICMFTTNLAMLDHNINSVISYTLKQT